MPTPALTGVSGALVYALRGDVYLADPTGTTVAEVQASGFSWSPDSMRVAVWGKSQRTLDIYGVDGVRQASLPSPLTGSAADLVWMPDGSALLLADYATSPSMVVRAPAGRHARRRARGSRIADSIGVYDAKSYRADT